jgi:hypothetical protein
MTVMRLCKKLPTAFRESNSSEASFKALNDSANPELVKGWEAQELVAQEQRDTNEAAMDIFDVKTQKGEAPVFC